MVRLMQKKPLKEWVTVYFDSAKTTPEKILKHLREKESPEAALVAPVTEEKSAVKVVVENPVAGPGDLVQVTIRLPEGAKGSAKLTGPKGWAVPTHPRAKSDILRVDVKVPTAEAPGSYKGSVLVTHGKEGSEVTIPFAVEIVPRVESKGK